MPNLQVAKAISEWERLLRAIESRMPSSTTPGKGKERASPLQPETIQNLRLSTFAQRFLTRARRPKGWTFVAPGIGTFPFEASLHAAEPEATSEEASEEGEDWVTLLFPSVPAATATPESTPVQVPADVSRHPDRHLNSFDKPYGFGKATVGRRAGLYTSWTDERDGDLVQLVCPSGRTNAGVFGGSCPWGPDRLPRLAEVLGHWAGLIEDGVWAVGEDGVEEDAAWFNSNVDLGNPNWDDMVGERF